MLKIIRGHGLDDNDITGSIASPSGEGIADIYAALRMGDSCIGRGFYTSGGGCTGKNALGLAMTIRIKLIMTHQSTSKNSQVCVTLTISNLAAHLEPSRYRIGAVAVQFIVWDRCIPKLCGPSTNASSKVHLTTMTTILHWRLLHV